MQAAAHMAEEARQECHHGARHPGHLDQQPEKDEKRHREQNEVAHPLVHAADQHLERRMGRRRQIAEDREPEGERDRHTGKDGGGDHADKKDEEVVVAEPEKDRRTEPEQRNDDGGTAKPRGERKRRAGPRQSNDGKNDHQGDADRQCGGAPGIGDL